MPKFVFRPIEALPVKRKQKTCPAGGYCADARACEDRGTCPRLRTRPIDDLLEVRCLCPERSFCPEGCCTPAQGR